MVDKQTGITCQHLIDKQLPSPTFDIPFDRAMTNQERDRLYEGETCRIMDDDRIDGWLLFVAGQIMFKDFIAGKVESINGHKDHENMMRIGRSLGMIDSDGIVGDEYN